MEAGWLFERLFYGCVPFHYISDSKVMSLPFIGSRKLRGECESASAHGQRVRWCLISFECDMTSFCSRIDISGEFSFTHLLEFSKLAVAFAIELGGWTE